MAERELSTRNVVEAITSDLTAKETKRLVHHLGVHDNVLGDIEEGRP